MAEKQLQCTAAAAEHQKAWFADLRQEVFEEEALRHRPGGYAAGIVSGIGCSRGQQSVVVRGRLGANGCLRIIWTK